MYDPPAVFYLFDNLLLLKRGGETVFVGELGEKCHKLVEYFEAIPGTAPLPKGYNPATWMLEVIGAGVGHDAGPVDFVDAFKNSEEKRILDTDLTQEGVTIPSPDYPEMVFTKKRAASSWTQARFLVGRFMNMYWRTPSYNLTRFIVTFAGAGVWSSVLERRLPDVSRHQWRCGHGVHDDAVQRHRVIQ